MKLHSLRILLIYFFIAVTFSFVLEKGQVNSLQTSNLGFGNQSGSSTTSGQISSFINFINSASTYYRDNTEQRLSYISNQMNSTYGANGQGFSVLQGDNESNYGWGIKTSSYVYASVAAGVDRVYPTKSYMFLREPVYSSGRVYFYNVGHKGYGIDSNLESVIRNTILSVETTSACYCSGISSTIRDLLVQYDGGTWNVFCSAGNALYANVYVYSGKYIYVKPKNCYYAIYEK